MGMLYTCIKEQYPIGSRVKVMSLANIEPTLPEGTEGVVVGYDNQPALLVDWENGSSLSVLPYLGDCIWVVA